MPTSVVNSEIDRVFRAHELPGMIPITHDPDTDTFHLLQSVAGLTRVANYVWDTNTLSWVRQTSSTGGGGPSADVNVLNFPATQNVSGSVGVTGSVEVTNDVGNPLPVSGIVAVNNFPATQATTVTKVALTGSAPASASVGTSSASVLAANPSRRGLVLTNLSAGNISFGLGAPAVLNSGITLTPNGVWVMDDYTFSVQEIFAIAAVAASALAIQEFA